MASCAEVILATNYTNEGGRRLIYVTALRAAEKRQELPGVPVGGELEYVDSGTVAQACGSAGLVKGGVAMALIGGNRPWRII